MSPSFWFYYGQLEINSIRNRIQCSHMTALPKYRKLEEGKVVINPIITKAQFKKELRGCVESSKIDPLEAKRIWKA